MDLREVVIDGANWIRLAQVRVQWRAFVSLVMDFRFHKERRLLFDKLSDYQLFKRYPAPWSK
jgi:short-subunit dehydrogenase involved in D-alanine esterification of teichoic acids